jgi:hypothetical protein
MATARERRAVDIGQQDVASVVGAALTGPAGDTSAGS